MGKHDDLLVVIFDFEKTEKVLDFAEIGEKVGGFGNLFVEGGWLVDAFDVLHVDLELEQAGGGFERFFELFCCV